MIKNYLLASTVLAGVLSLAIPASAVTVSGVAPKFQPAVSYSADSTLLIQVKGSKGAKSDATGKKGKGKGAGGSDDDDDQGDDSDDQGDDDQGDDGDSQ